MDQTFWTYFFVVLTFGVYIGIAIWSRRVLGAAVLLVLAVVLAGCVAPAGTSTEQHSGDDDVLEETNSSDASNVDPHLQNDICERLKADNDVNEFWLGVNPKHGSDIKLRLPLKYFKSYENAKRNSSRMNGRVSFSVRLKDFAPANSYRPGTPVSKYSSQNGTLVILGNVNSVSSRKDLADGLKYSALSIAEASNTSFEDMQGRVVLPSGYGELEMLAFDSSEPRFTDVFAEVVEGQVFNYMVCSQDYTSTNFKLPNPDCNLIMLINSTRVELRFAKSEAHRWNEFRNRTVDFLSCITVGTQ